MLHLRGIKLQLGLKPLRRNLTHSFYSVYVESLRPGTKKKVLCWKIVQILLNVILKLIKFFF